MGHGALYASPLLCTAHLNFHFVGPNVRISFKNQTFSLNIAMTEYSKSFFECYFKFKMK